MKKTGKGCRIRITPNNSSSSPILIAKVQRVVNNISIKMNPQDFEGLCLLKMIVPVVYVISWASMLLGPLYFDRPYQIVCVAIVIAFSILKVSFLGVAGAIASYKLKKILDRVQNGTYEKFSNQLTDPIFHAIVIPNYKQQIEVLAETLETLAKHDKATSNYLIFLAMEAHEKDCDHKAQILINRFQSRFRHITYTRHQLREGEAKGKSSNVNWCYEHMNQVFQRHIISEESVMITSIDADSLVPGLYMAEIEAYIRKHPENMRKAIFAGPQIFSRNSAKTSPVVRVYDIMHGFAHLANLPSIYFSFPLSNYTLSYSLVERVQGWDTCQDAVGEDFHMVQKAYWKTNRDIITVPIYVPFNQLSLQTDKGHFADIKARFWQAERHSQGVTDVAYNIKQFFTNPFAVKNLFLIYCVIETFTMSATIPWFLISMIVRYILMSEEGISGDGWVFSWYFINVLINLANICSIISYLSYEYFKRMAVRRIYNQPTESKWRMLEYPILFMVTIFGITVPSMAYSAFSVLCFNRHYNVTEKAGAHSNIIPAFDSTKNMHDLIMGGNYYQEDVSSGITRNPSQKTLG